MTHTFTKSALLIAGPDPTYASRLSAIVSSVSVRTLAGLLLVVTACSTSTAAVNPVRVYSMGDEIGEGDGVGAAGPANGEVVSSDSGGLLDVYDSAGSFEDLDQAGDPVYHEITGTDTSGGHPGAVGTFGIAFDGTDDALSHATPLNEVANDGSQGLQMWVYADSGSLNTASGQVIVFDASNAGGPAISPTGMWTQVNSGHTDLVAEANLVGTVPVVGDTWHHVAQHIFLSSDSAAPVVDGAEAGFTSVIYVNGIAVSANNDTNGTDAVGAFTVGAADDGAELSAFFNGVMDELSVYTSSADSFDLFVDNDYIASQLPGGFVSGDLNLDGNIDGGDVSAFVDGWLKEKQLVGAHNTMFVGDLETYGWGDLNLDGRVNLADAYLLHEALEVAGVSSLELGQLGVSQVPEPSTIVLLAGIVGLGCTVGRYRK